jgi:hypothetical protein
VDILGRTELGTVQFVPFYLEVQTLLKGKQTDDFIRRGFFTPVSIVVAGVIFLSAFLSLYGDEIPGDLRIESIDRISKKGPPQVTEITDSDARLLFESSIPLACSVVYGKTTDYGMIAVDQDMGGGAHSDHRPLMTGLESDTLYHYRVQGSAVDGMFYISEDRTFRTALARKRSETNITSLKQGATVIGVSSNWGNAENDGSWGANSALDEQRGTEWSSNGDGNNAYIHVQFVERSRVYAVEVWTRSMSDGTAIIESFTLTTDSGERLGPFHLRDDKQAYRFEIDEVTTSLRLDVHRSTGGNTGLVEFAAYGTPVRD